MEFNALNYTGLIPIVIAAMKEQQIVITDLKIQVETLKKEIENVKAALKQ